MSKIILITGGSGFIGSNLSRKLLGDKSNFVVCLDNLYSSSIDNILELKNNQNFLFINKDVTDKSILSLPFSQIDEIYHLACPASPPLYQKDPIFTLDTNYLGTKNVLEVARKYNSKILLASTSEIYGDPMVDEQHENYWGNVNSYGPRSCYDEGKRVAETLFREYRMKYNLETRIVRIFNTYGPFMNKNDGRVVSNFINQALEGKMITIYGNGKQTRSLCYIDDLLEGITMLMKSDISEPTNIGNPNEMTINELACKIIELTSSKSSVIFMKLPEDDPQKRKPVIKKAIEKLNWYPKVSLEDGLIKTINYYKSV
tara:strand:- start:1696 stop:2640 length:945 start_codon:yes stop_codon:yes gene_type:complete